MEQGQYRYLLVVLDVFSKYGWIPLKEKKKLKLWQKLFRKYLWVDKGKEFYNKHLKDFLLEKNKIEICSTENEDKSSVCERGKRTIKTKLSKQFTVQGSTQYLDILPKILKQLLF